MEFYTAFRQIPKLLRWMPPPGNNTGEPTSPILAAPQAGALPTGPIRRADGCFSGPVPGYTRSTRPLANALLRSVIAVESTSRRVSNDREPITMWFPTPPILFIKTCSLWGFGWLSQKLLCWATFVRMTCSRGGWSGRFIRFRKRENWATPHGHRNRPGNTLAEQMPGRAWPSTESAGLFTSPQVQLPMIFMAEIGKVTICLPTVYWPLMPRLASGSGITNWFTTTFGTATHPPRPPC